MHSSPLKRGFLGPKKETSKSFPFATLLWRVNSLLVLGTAFYFSKPWNHYLKKNLAGCQTDGRWGATKQLFEVQTPPLLEGDSESTYIIYSYWFTYIYIYIFLYGPIYALFEAGSCIQFFWFVGSLRVSLALMPCDAFRSMAKCGTSKLRGPGVW